MLTPLRLLPSTMRRGALVLAFACTFGNPALAHAAAASGAPVVTGVRAGVEGALTRITIAGSAPLAYGVRRADAATLLVELPGADATHLAASYAVASPLASTVRVQCASDANGQPLARLRVALLAPVRERSYMSGSDLVLELAPTQ